MPQDKTRLVLADDHETVREGLMALLHGLGEVDVVSAVADGDQTLEAVLTHRPDVLVLDLSMPTSGFVVLRTVKDQAPATAVVILTRHRESAYVREAFDSGASGYVLKQSPFRELTAAILAAKRGEQYLDSQLVEPAQPGRLRGRLSKRETDVLRLAARGLSNKEVAVACNIAVKTVEVHKANAMRKLGLKDRCEMLRYAINQGWLTDV
jgi:DNA-binding NarL/FixJ family response regulator